MRKSVFIGIMILFVSFSAKSQNDTIKSNNLLNEVMKIEKDSTQLLPDKFLFTQRILWGKKGLMRNFNCFELSTEERKRELKIRRIMLVSHQVFGFATLAGMVAQGIVGTKLYNGDTTLLNTHAAIAVGINVCYFTTAFLSLFSPPKMLNERAGFSSIKIHKAIAIVHFSSMIATNILAGLVGGNDKLRPYHRAAAFTAFGSFALSMVVLKF